MKFRIFRALKTVIKPLIIRKLSVNLTIIGNCQNQGGGATPPGHLGGGDRSLASPPGCASRRMEKYCKIMEKNGRNSVVGAIPRWAQFRDGRNSVVGAIQWWAQFSGGRNSAMGAIPRWAQFRDGRNSVVGAIPRWAQFRDGRNSVVGAIP